MSSTTEKTGGRARGTRERLLKSGAAPGRGGRHRAEGAPGGRAGPWGRRQGGGWPSTSAPGAGGGDPLLRLDRSTGLLTFVETTEAPTDGWITFDPAQRALYARFRNNRVAGFRLDQSSGRLTAGDVQPTGTGATPTSASTPPGDLLGGQLRWGRGGVNPILGEGRLGEPTQVIPTAGSRAGAARPGAPPAPDPFDPAGAGRS